MAARVIVHAGFHKTGSTTIQRFLRNNRKELSPRVQLLLPFRLGKGAARLAMRHSRFRTPQLLDEFAAEMCETLAPIDPARDLVLSHENLAGRMPGRDGQKGYDCAPELMARLAVILRAHFGPDADIRFCFLTRAPDSWLKSLWLHNLRVSRLQQDLHEFRAEITPLDTTPETLALIEQVIAPASLHTVALEQCVAPRFGPAQLLIDQLDLPQEVRTKLAPEPAHNIGPALELAPELLALNRSALDDETLTARKAALLERPAIESPTHVRHA